MGEAPTMPNSSPSKLALWMEYSLADLDKSDNLVAHVLSYDVFEGATRRGSSGSKFIVRSNSMSNKLFPAQWL
jgi:hypothetical protein